MDRDVKLEQLIAALRNPAAGTPTASAVLMLQAADLLDRFLGAFKVLGELLSELREG